MQSPGSDVRTSTIAVPDDAVDELIEVRLVSKIAGRRRTQPHALLTIGSGSTARVTLTQDPITVYLLATWVVARARRLGATITITGNRPSNTVRFQVYGDEPPETVANYLVSALNG